MSLFKVGASKIQGKGVLAAHKLEKGDSVGQAIEYEWWGGIIPLPVITKDLGVWINHSYKPNAMLEWRSEKGQPSAWYLVTTEPIEKGGEVTLNYEDTPWYIEGARPHYV